jgi:hypothetical protein
MSQWKNQNERYVAFIDILGFKELVMRETHEEVSRKLYEIRKIIEMLEKQDRGEVELKTVQFSDSIIQITSDGSPRSAHELLLSTSWLLSGCLANRLPVKGSIAFGMMTSDCEHSLYFGQPLIDAVLLQEDLKLYGMILHHTAEYQMLKLCETTLRQFCVQYETPLSGAIVKHWNIDWTHPAKKLSNPINMSTLETFLYCSVSGNPRKYVDNTFAFVRNIEKTQMQNKETVQNAR